MQWLEGDPLNIYLGKVYNQKSKIEKLLTDFIQLINELGRFGIAHGDLQHGNIIVKNDRLHLIDYDGMYFPELTSLKTNEIGHINYQHPKRSASHYNQHIDRFSAIVIYIGLKAISLKPTLWTKYENGENILFRSQDYGDLQHSSLIQDLSIIPEIKPLVERLIGCCHLDFEKVPSLNNFLSGSFIYDKGAVGTIRITRSQYEIIDGNKSGSILEHFGEKIEVVGKICAIKSAKTKYDDPYTFLNFTHSWPNHTFTIVIWQEGIATLIAKGMSPASIVGKYVSVTGVIGSYSSKSQMIIEQPTQIRILANESESNRILKPRTTNVKTTPIPQPTTKVISKEADVFNNLYKNKPVYTPPKTLLPQTHKATTPIQSRTTSKPPTPSYYGTSQTSKTSSSSNTNSKNNSNGCIAPIVFAVIGAIVIGAASEGSLWFIGAIGGGFWGSWIHSWFKS